MTGRRKGTITLLLLTVMLLAFGITASAGFQKMPGGRYRYYVTKNSYLKGQKNGEVRIPALKNLAYKGKKYTYAFDENGYMLTGWCCIPETRTEMVALAAITLTRMARC